MSRFNDNKSKSNTKAGAPLKDAVSSYQEENKLNEDNSYASENDKSEPDSPNDSVVSNLELTKIDNPRQRELLLIAKVKILQEKLKTKKNLISNFKETLESDEKVKKTLQEKIYELKSKIDSYRENALKRGMTVQDLDANMLNEGPMLIKDDEDEDVKDEMELINQKRGDFEYMLATSAIANEHQNKLFIKKGKTCWGRFTHKWHNFLNFFTPFTKDIQHIAYRYDRDTQFVFEIFRFLIILSIGVLVTFLYFLVTHALNSDFTAGNLYCKYNIPCLLFYSRITVSESTAYSITYVVMTFFVLYFSVEKSLQFSKLNTNSKLHAREENKFSQFFFTKWDWSTKTRGMYVEKKRRLRELFRISNQEVGIKKVGKTAGQIVCNYSLRFLSLILTVLILFVYAIFILGSYFVRLILKSKDTNKTTFEAIDVIFEIIPTLIVVISGMIFPAVIELLPKIEKWDYESTVRKQMTIRYIIGRVFGLAIIYYVNIFYALLDNSLLSLISFTGLSVSISRCPGTAVFNSDRTAYSNIVLTPISKALYAECSEDDMVINILFIALADFIIRLLWDLILFSFVFCCNPRKRNQGESYKWPFRPGKAAVDIFILNLQLFAIIPYFPFIVALMPLILFTQFKFEKFKLLKLRSKPLKFDIEAENGSNIMKLFNFSVLLLMIFNTVFYISYTPHGYYVECYNNPNTGNIMLLGTQTCGPYPTLTPVSTTFLSGILSINFLQFIYTVIANPEPLVILLIVLICNLVHNSYDIEAFKMYVRETEKDLIKTINSLQGKVEGLNKTNKNLVVNRLD